MARSTTTPLILYLTLSHLPRSVKLHLIYVTDSLTFVSYHSYRHFFPFPPHYPPMPCRFPRWLAVARHVSGRHGLALLICLLSPSSAAALRSSFPQPRFDRLGDVAACSLSSFLFLPPTTRRIGGCMPNNRRRWDLPDIGRCFADYDTTCKTQITAWGTQFTLFSMRRRASYLPPLVRGQRRFLA